MRLLLAISLIVCSITLAWKGSEEIKRYETYAESLVALKGDFAIQAEGLNKFPISNNLLQERIAIFENRISELSPKRGLLLIAGSFVLLILESVQKVRICFVFVEMGLSPGGRIAGYPWNGYPQCAQRRAGPSGRKPLWGSVLFRFWLRCSRGPRPSGH